MERLSDPHQLWGRVDGACRDPAGPVDIIRSNKRICKMSGFKTIYRNQPYFYTLTTKRKKMNVRSTIYHNIKTQTIPG